MCLLYSSDLKERTLHFMKKKNPSIDKFVYQTIYIQVSKSKKFLVKKYTKKYSSASPILITIHNLKMDMYNKLWSRWLQISKELYDRFPLIMVLESYRSFVYMNINDNVNWINIINISIIPRKSYCPLIKMKMRLF